MTPSAVAERDATAPSPLDVGFDKEDHDNQMREATRLYKRGRYEDALTRFDAAGPAPGRLHMHLGYRSGVLHALGRDEEAYDEALRGLVETQEGAKDATLWRRLRNAANALAERDPDHFPRLARSMPSLDDSHAALLALARTARAEGITEADVVFETILDPEEPETIPGETTIPDDPERGAPPAGGVFEETAPASPPPPPPLTPGEVPRALASPPPTPPKAAPLPATSTPAVVALEALAADVKAALASPSGTIAPADRVHTSEGKKENRKIASSSALASFRASARTHGCACVRLPADLRDALDAAARAARVFFDQSPPTKRRHAPLGSASPTGYRASAPLAGLASDAAPERARLAAEARSLPRHEARAERFAVADAHRSDYPWPSERFKQRACDAHAILRRVAMLAGDALLLETETETETETRCSSEFVGDGSEGRRRSDDARESSAKDASAASAASAASDAASSAILGLTTLAAFEDAEAEAADGAELSEFSAAVLRELLAPVVRCGEAEPEPSIVTLVAATRDRTREKEKQTEPTKGKGKGKGKGNEGNEGGNPSAGVSPELVYTRCAFGDGRAAEWPPPLGGDEDDRVIVVVVGTRLGEMTGGAYRAPRVSHAGRGNRARVAYRA